MNKRGIVEIKHIKRRKNYVPVRMWRRKRMITKGVMGIREERSRGEDRREKKKKITRK